MNFLRRIALSASLKKKPLLIFLFGFILFNLASIFHLHSGFTQEPRDQTEIEVKKIFKSKNDDLNYLKRYPFIHDCKIGLPVWNEGLNDTEDFNYGSISPPETHTLRIVRGILIYFPIEKYEHFQQEFQWLYRTWIEMIQYEFTHWRTDLIVFVNNDIKLFSDDKFFFNELNCSFSNRRRSRNDKPMCTLINFISLSKRNNTMNQTFINNDEHYDYLLRKVDIFSDNPENLAPFYNLAGKNLKTYGYSDSILMAFDGYKYFKEADFDFLVRTDMDVFLTPLLGQWAPRYCNDFYAGSGAFTNTFNAKRFIRIARNIGIQSANKWNLGSTWISSPDQFRLASYLTLFGMAYLYEEEFSPDERLEKLGTLGWPYWHYGVLLLYGQHVALNHLIASKTFHVVHLHNLLDYPSGNDESIFSKLHIHVYHGDDIFSKFLFRLGRYNYTLLEGKNDTHIRYFALKMALESRFTPLKELYKNFQVSCEVKL